MDRTTRAPSDPNAARPALSRARTRLFRIVFGDHGGLFVFLASLSIMMLLWRFQISITDNITHVNGLAALTDGHLYVTDPVYGDSLASSGMRQVNGRAYPETIGLLVVALPVLFALRAVTAVMDLHVAVAAAWSLILIGTIMTGSRLLGREGAGRVVAAGLALGCFLGSLALVEPAKVDHLALPALQLTALLLAGVIAVLLYRLTRQAYDRRVGLAAGLTTGLATPTLLWATIPKRHVPVAALAVCSVYLLYRSRTADSTTSYRRLRLLAYAPVGLSAWVFVGAAGLLGMALAVADLATARGNGGTTLAGIAGVVFVSSIPFFVTNVLVSGDPLTSPAMLPSYEPSSAASGSGVTGGGGGPSSVKGASAESPLPVVLQQGVYLLEQYYHGLEVAVSDPGRLTTIFVRSGWFERLSVGSGGAISLSVTESMPLVGALVALPVVLLGRPRAEGFTPIHIADLFVLTYTVVTLLFYIPRLPGHAQFTVRYLFVVYLLAVYGLVRLPWVRDAIQSKHRLLAWTYADGVLIGGQLALAGLVLIDATFPEAMQALALVGLATAGGLAAWSLASATGREWPRVGAIALALAGAAATNLYLIVVIYYYGARFALPLVPA